MLQLFPEKKLPLAFDLSERDWLQWVKSKGLAPFVAKQIYQWIFAKNCQDPLLFSNLSLDKREMLKREFLWDLPSIDSHLISKDESEKYLLKTADSLFFEMVLMPYENRVTLCISSQVGCRMGCTFCQTGKLGLKRNLSAGEILSQILIANARLQKEEKRLTNVVFMGMGEPLDNYEAVLQACSIMVDKEAFGLSSSRVTISTSGLVEEIERLGTDLPVRLAISLHSADNAKRSQMMPINRRYDLETLKRSLMKYPAPKRLGITFEYVMIEGENDTLQDAKRLVHFLHGLKAKVNLIPVNDFPGMALKRSHEERIRAFQAYLSERSIPAPVRYSRGQDISAGCGQLAAKREDELNTDPRLLARERRAQERELETSE